MDLNQIASYTSIIAFLAMLIGGLWKFIKRYRKYTTAQNAEREEFKRFLVDIVSTSGTADERNDANSFVQHFLAQHRHMIIQSYLNICVYLLWGTVGFLILYSFDFLIYAYLFIAGAASWAMVEFWLLTLYRRKVSEAEWDVGKAWAEHIDRERYLKVRRTDG